MSPHHSDSQTDLLTLIGELTGWSDDDSALTRIADVWRRVVRARVAFVAVAGDDQEWTVTTASPLHRPAPPTVDGELAAALPDGDVRLIDPSAISTDLAKLDGGPGHAGIGVRLTPRGGRPHLLIGLDLESSPDTTTLSQAAAVAAISRVVVERDAAGLASDTERAKTARLVSAGLALSSELDVDEVLQRVVDTACEVLDARYAALGVLASDGQSLSRFVTSGLSDAERTAIGALPRGRGLLGLLITEARPIRVASIADDPRSVGFPAHHPPMGSFLGVPIRVGPTVFGNLYVTERRGGPFTEDDELVALTLAAQAAVAIGNAHRYGEQEQTALSASRERERATADGWRRAIEAQEAERARIARELHDEAGQELTALALQLRAMDDHVTDDAGREHLAAVRQALARTSTNLRALAIELRPSGLREHGLASAIERQAARLQESSGITIDVAVSSLPNDLMEPFEVALFRVVQEALTNVARHSDATHASVIASLRDGRLRIVIEDDGIGFDPSRPTDRLGLAGIRERIQLVGGDLRIESAYRAGTTVIVEVEVPNG